MTKIRVLLVEDSLTVRARLRELVEADPELELAGEAEDGKRAIELCQALTPDVVSLDMNLPIMSGLAATECIMAYCPTPTLIVSSSFDRGELYNTYDALAAGAVDVMEKPRGDEAEGTWERRYIATLKLVSRIRVITHPRARLGNLGRRAVEPRPTSWPPAEGRGRIIAMGASTGGPGAIAEVLRGIPLGLGVPIVVMLHIDEPFAEAFAQWLDNSSPHRVSIPADGELVLSYAGRVVMAPPGRHLVIQGGRLRFDGGPMRNSCRPSIDVLFESIAREYGSSAVACLLTGMGCDGASGLLDVRKAGGATIAQDEETSIVYGMPREAARLDAAASVLPIDQIGAAAARACRRAGGSS
jgi:two-component system, chemotaxis family, protein-glutamate methylesterase/glutaminase